MAETTIPTTAQEESRAPATREESRFLVPPVDIYETSEGLTVVADLPGVTKDNLDVRVENNVLTIKGRVTPKTRGDNLYQEYELHDFFRQFELIEDVDQEKITAELKQGVLTLKLPKAEAAKPKKITVKVN